MRFRSWAAWRDEFSGNLAVFCSDERFVTATLEFLRRAMDMERCDLMVVAGGPAFIAQDEPNLMERLKLLVSAHRLQRIALITHADCGYYKHRYGNEAAQKQREELLAAMQRLRQQLSGVEVRGFWALVEGGEVVFEELAGEE